LPMINKEKVIALVEERMNELNNGLYIVELTISSANSIHVEIDKIVGGVTVTDCVSVSRNVEHNLDRDEEDFELHVSSAGLDKPLRHINQYIKNIGRRVEIVRKDGEKLEGEIIKITDDTMIIKDQVSKQIENKKKKVLVEEVTEVHFSDVKESKIVISFK
jgi:ribosome maturation factor RimP